MRKKHKGDYHLEIRLRLIDEDTDIMIYECRSQNLILRGTKEVYPDGPRLIDEKGSLALKRLTAILREDLDH